MVMVVISVVVMRFHGLVLLKLYLGHDRPAF
jgi:hypothetical protein